MSGFVGGNAAIVNGIYHITGQLHNGWPLYRRWDENNIDGRKMTMYFVTTESNNGAKDVEWRFGYQGSKASEPVAKFVIPKNELTRFSMSGQEDCTSCMSPTNLPPFGGAWWLRSTGWRKQYKPQSSVHIEALHTGSCGVAPADAERRPYNQALRNSVLSSAEQTRSSLTISDHMDTASFHGTARYSNGLDCTMDRLVSVREE